MELAPSAGDTTPAHHDVIIIGTGFAGLGMAMRLRRDGVEDFVLLERAAELGGTWRDNTYPGCACDVPSHLYSYSFEPNPRWSRMYSGWSEILDYLKGCAHRHGLLPHIRFNAEVVEARWDEEHALWRVRCADGRRFEAPVLVPAMGALSNPAFADIPGRDSFAGPSFHSAHWRHDLPLDGLRVAVIGSGASAVQFLPRIAAGAARVDYYQRTPPWVLPKPDRAIAPAEQERFERQPWRQRLWRFGIYWALESRVLLFLRGPRVMKLLGSLVKKEIARRIDDPALRAKITPGYTPGCKRILIANDYYPALARSNVQVITEPIRGITERGVVGDVEREVDVIIHATGFKVQEGVPPGMFFGRDGLDLGERWAGQGGPQAYLGSCINGFPNLFMLVGPNTGLGHSSMIFMIESQIEFVMQALRALRQGRARSLEVKAEVEAGYNEGLRRRLGRTVWASGCRSWYLNASGRNTALWPGSTFAFRRLTRRFRAEQFHPPSS
ncbi:flavin-containing monooxygenase [Rivibacter subsaxonicus]|uniref:Cation diffusion facilitator CzcD-associated flavoprotein CzcO n=1 Tax=Rivibacter subsaxonicus TaxID=457575 RepID=A0A4Q7VNU0_9BURK|nr:NAD(P)/FAD-dependent oxidoreductase [Rivibacter subsaxonicus]RZT98002.1 cation diffusion facilitator CzcD-associated flavoprotein CzcO [Rivibacter subsaxonicus]